MQKLTIIKVGGKVVEDNTLLAPLLEDFIAIKGKKLLVHGGGKLSTELSNQLGISVQMINGRRITDADTLRVVTMVYGGLVNKNMVAKLQGLGCNALGICGADLNLITAVKRPLKNGIDYGFVGDITQVNVEKIIGIINDDIIPVIAPLTHDGKGQLFNTNADTIPAELAKALSAFYDVDLVYCFEKRGVLEDENNDDSVIKTLTRKSYEVYKYKGIIKDGMIPKLDNGFDAINQGVKHVYITNAKALKTPQEGTLLKR